MGAAELGTRIEGTTGSEKITVSSSSVAFAAVPHGATGAVCVVETAALRYKKGGSLDKPTASVGIPVEAGQSIVFLGDLSKVWLIRRDGSDAVVNVEYYA